jgi:hypothetical protein
MTRVAAFGAAALLIFSAVAPAQSKREEKTVERLHARDTTFQGVLIDAGCRDRSVWNMKRPPEPLDVAIAPTGQGTQGGEATRSQGVSVDASTINAERSDVTPVLVNADSAVRQSDPTCAIKGNTRAFALLLNDGRLLDLDEAGNTYATAMVSATPQGRAMLSGKAGGFKPRVSIVGWVQQDRLFTQDLKLKQ